MRAWVLIGLYFLPIVCSSQQSTRQMDADYRFYLQQFIQTDGGMSLSLEEFETFVGKLESKRTKADEVTFLRTLFNRTHHKFLRHYTDQASFSELFKTGRYNCLTGTSLFSILLERFEFEYQIIETNYHIFILVQANGNPVLFEATDPQSGFTSDEKMIKERIARYRENTIQEMHPDRYHYKFSFDLYNKVEPEELTGLLYYNLAVAAFNENSLDRAVQLLDRAFQNYRSERIEEFSKIMLLALVESDLEASAKISYVRKVQSLRQMTLL